MNVYKDRGPINRSFPSHQARANKVVKYNANGEALLTAGDCPIPRRIYDVRRMDEIRGRTCFQLKSTNAVDRKTRKQSRAAYDRRRHLKARIEQEIDEKAKELQGLDNQLAARERIRDLASKAPSVKEMRAAVSQLFKDEKLDPIKELIRMVKRRGANALSAKEKATILKELAQYQAPKPKAVDIQADMDMSVTVGMVDFRSAGQRVIKEAIQEGIDDEAYDEFERRDGKELES